MTIHYLGRVMRHVRLWASRYIGRWFELRIGQSMLLLDGYIKLISQVHMMKGK